MATGIYSDYGNYYNPYATNGNYSPYGTNTYGAYPQNQDVAVDLVSTKPSNKKKALDLNDGKIGFWKAAGNFGKGVLKFFTGMVTDNQGHFSLGKTLKTALTVAGIGAVCVLTAGTAIPALIAAGGVAAAGIGMGASAIKIATAKTDAEAEAAWQSLGANTTAAGIAVVGARAVAKSAHPEMATELKGPQGLWKGTAQVFKDSGKAISDSASGISNAVKGGVGFKGKLTAGKDEIVAQFTKTKNVVKGNYEKSVYNIKGKINKKSENIGKEIEAKKAERAKIKDNNSSQAKALDKEIARLEKRQSAINEINQAKSRGEANSKIQENRRAVIDKEAALEKTTDAKTQAQLKEEIAELESTISEQVRILERRTSEVTSINEGIKAQEAKLEKLNKQLAEADAKAKESISKQIAEVTKVKNDLIAKRTNADFKVPEYKVEEYYTTEAEMTFNRTQNAVTEAQTKLNNEKIELGKINEATNPAEYKAQQAKVEQAKNDLIDATAAHKKSQLSINSDKAHNAVVDGKGSSIHAPREIMIDAYNNPAARWLTVSAAGKQTGFGQQNNLYNYLSDTEKAYFDSLSPQEQATILATYNQYI